MRWDNDARTGGARARESGAAPYGGFGQASETEGVAKGNAVLQREPTQQNHSLQAAKKYLTNWLIVG